MRGLYSLQLGNIQKIMISKEEWAERLGRIPIDDEHYDRKVMVARIQADALLEAAKIASEYHTFGGVHQGLLRRAKELQEGK